MKVKWILQSNLTGASTLSKIRKAIESDTSACCEEIKIIPFSEELDYEVPEDGDKYLPVVYGSTTMMLNAYRHPYLTQGVFFNEETFRMSNYLKQWGNRMLNDDAEIVSVNDFISRNTSDDTEIFIRPDEDSKSFTGMVTNIGSYREMIGRVIDHNPHITGSAMVAVSSPKQIEKEWRNIIAGTTVVSSALYRKNGKAEISTDDIPAEMTAFVQECLDTYRLHDIFVVDVALCENEYKMIECNCFNATGFYDEDIEGIVKKINAHLIWESERSGRSDNPGSKGFVF